LAPRPPRFNVPFQPPFSLVNRTALSLFNVVYSRIRRERAVVSMEKFFYPLDAVGMWNRLYGPKGLLQWQALIPVGADELAREILSASDRSGSGSFLTVLKSMGKVPAAGMMSFAGPGLTISLDFPFDSAPLPLLSRLDAMVAEAGGRLYPAKDARMSGQHFRRFYPNWEEFSKYVDPGFSSSLWRRVMR
jgi:FAD/FMN-containing dehydrogenase